MKRTIHKNCQNWMMWLLGLLCWSVIPSYAQNAVVTGTVNATSQNLDKREVHESFPLTDGGVVSVSNISGYIRVTSWTESRVELNAVKRSRNDEDWQQVAIEINARPQHIEVRTVYPRGKSNSTAVDYELKVPRSAVLNSMASTSGNITVAGPVARLIARSTSGNVTATDITGDTSLTSTSGNARAERISGALSIISTSGDLVINDVASRLNARTTSGDIQATKVRDDATATAASGDVRLENIGGRVNASTMSGLIAIRQVGGDVNASSISSSVTAQEVRGRVTANAISGNVTIRQAEEGARAQSVSGSILLANSKGRLEAETVSGGITLQNIDAHELRLKSLSSGVRYEGKLYHDGTYELQSHSGTVELILPPDSEFNLVAQTFSGSVNTEFPLQLSSGTIGGRGQVLGVVGKGGARVSVTSFSGNILLKKITAVKEK